MGPTWPCSPTPVHTIWVWGGVLINPSVGLRKHSPWLLNRSQLKIQNQGRGLKAIKWEFNPKGLGTRQALNRTRDEGAEQKPGIHPFMAHSFVHSLSKYLSSSSCMSGTDTYTKDRARSETESLSQGASIQVEGDRQ